MSDAAPVAAPPSAPAPPPDPPPPSSAKDGMQLGAASTRTRLKAYRVIERAPLRRACRSLPVLRLCFRLSVRGRLALQRPTKRVYTRGSGSPSAGRSNLRAITAIRRAAVQ